jgi:hypothetical protein
MFAAEHLLLSSLNGRGQVKNHGRQRGDQASRPQRWEGPRRNAASASTTARGDSAKNVAAGRCVSTTAARATVKTAEARPSASTTARRRSVKTVAALPSASTSAARFAAKNARQRPRLPLLPQPPSMPLPPLSLISSSRARGCLMRYGKFESIVHQVDCAWARSLLLSWWRVTRCAGLVESNALQLIGFRAVR